MRPYSGGFNYSRVVVCGSLNTFVDTPQLKCNLYQHHNTRIFGRMKFRLLNETTLSNLQTKLMFIPSKDLLSKVKVNNIYGRLKGRRVRRGYVYDNKPYYVSLEARKLDEPLYTLLFSHNIPEHLVSKFIYNYYFEITDVAVTTSKLFTNCRNLYD